ncbi:hypothetical protein AVEN_105714-1 [Araneus ventricosus]|uniref:Uncharacterized protein n=1 Tax=Araneus ventricosus TaxID=182803 RepID=A0A4Y2PIR4_ARAVE|nr:hypothetical protein AVEN_105714-1 [Araneus ventricosus]
MNCVKHQEPTTDVEVVEKGQYVGPVHSTPDFQVVSPKKSAKFCTVETNSPLETSNKYQSLMDTEEREKDSSPPKISIPAINLKINNDYNLTLQEINRNSPNTENKYDRGYILPLSLDDREKNHRIPQPKRKRIRASRCARN